MWLNRAASGDEEPFLGGGCVASKLAPLHWDVEGRVHVASDAQAYGFTRVLTVAPCRLGGTSTRPKLQELVGYGLTLLFDFSLVVAFESDNRPRLSKKS